MASIVGHKLSLRVGEAIPEWAKFDWNEEIQHDIYRDWGTYYYNRHRMNLALHYYNQALELDDLDYGTLYRRSQTQRRAANIEGALSDAKRAEKMAEKLRGPNCSINEQICDALFELNQFEISNMELHNNRRAFVGVKSKRFEQRLIVGDDVIKDVTGKAMSLFFMKNRKLVERDSYFKKVEDNRPMWKQLRDQGKCDVLSIPEIEEEFLSPMEVARRQRAFNVSHQTYMNDSWKDIVFMKNLRNNPNLLLPQCKRSRDFLEMISKKQYDIVRQFMKMLQSRNPLYYINYLKNPNKKLLEQNKEANLFRIQYQTWRDMISNLKHIRLLRQEKKIKALGDYVEKIMGDNYVLKQNRVMCWKFEFINEVYNILALALTEQYYVPKNFKVNQTALMQILHLKNHKLKDIVPFVFGDRSTYQEGDDQDLEGKKARKLLSRLDNRIRFAKYDIERAYLYFKLAAVHLGQLHYDECCLHARKCIKASSSCNSIIWSFLGHLQIVKANAMQHKVERTKEALELIHPIVVSLNSPTLLKFIETCMSISEDDFNRKGSSMASRRSSKYSVMSGDTPEKTENNNDD